MQRIKNNFGYILIIGISIIPLIIWAFILPIKYRFFSLESSATSFGQITGILGMSLFALSIILSARLKKFDWYLKGLNRVYINHHRLGAIAFSLLLFHPLLLTVRYLKISLTEAVSFWLPDTNWALNAGKISLLGMIILLVLTFFISLKYDIWKKTHKFLGLIFFIGVCHTFAIPSDVSNNLGLKIYMGILSSLALAAYTYQTLLGKYLIKKYPGIIKNISKLNDKTVLINLELKTNKKFSYKAGQFIFISFIDKNIGLEQHPFSLVSNPSENQISIAIKSLGDYTSLLGNLKPGTEALIEGPFGKFSYKNTKNKNQLWIAGGIGITPFVSMAKDLCSYDKNNEYHIDLYYCANDSSELVLFDSLKQVANSCSNFNLVDFCANEKGRINADTISKITGNLPNKDIFVCGPPAMMSALKKQFINLGVKKTQIHSEEFQF